MTYSEDLRQRVVDFVRAGGAKSEASRRFKVSRGCIYNWLPRKTLAAKKTRNVLPYKLDPEKLKAHVAAHPDAYQYERAEALGVSRQVVLYGLKRLGIRRKKNTAVSRAKRQSSQSIPRSPALDSRI
jgi:transposase